MERVLALTVLRSLTIRGSVVAVRVSIKKPYPKVGLDLLVDGDQCLIPLRLSGLELLDVY